MISYDYLIACTSWEERFSEGIEHSCKTHEIENVLLFGVSEFKHRVESPSQDTDPELPTCSSTIPSRRPPETTTWEWIMPARSISSPSPTVSA